MSDWTKFRDTAEAAAVLVGNYYFPGSSMITKHLVSDGAEEKLDSKEGKLLQLGTGGTGALNGNLANWTGGGEGGMNLPFNIGKAPVSGIDLGGPGSSPSNMPVDWSAAPNESSAETARLLGQNQSAKGVPVDNNVSPFTQAKETYSKVSDAKAMMDVASSLSKNAQQQQQQGTDAPADMEINGSNNRVNDQRRQALLEKAAELRQRIAQLRAQVAREQSVKQTAGTPA